jgi:fatty acid desaturase
MEFKNISKMENQQDLNSYQQYQEHLKQPMSVGDWFIAILITAIPLVGLIMLLIWAFGSNTNVNKANWAKATLIWMVIGIIIGGFIFMMVGAALFSEWY